MIVPEMGTNSSAGSVLAEALFSSVQRRVLALLLGHPERSFQSAELIRLVRGGTGGVHRELRRLEKAGWLTVARIGNQKHYQANRACPGFHELHGLVVKTLGVARSVRREAKALPEEQRFSSAPEPGPAPNDGWKVW